MKAVEVSLDCDVVCVCLLQDGGSGRGWDTSGHCEGWRRCNQREGCKHWTLGLGLERIGEKTALFFAIYI